MCWVILRTVLGKMGSRDHRLDITSIRVAFLSADMELTCKTTFIEDFKRVSQCVDVPSCFVKHH